MLSQQAYTKVDFKLVRSSERAIRNEVQDKISRDKKFTVYLFPLAITSVTVVRDKNNAPKKQQVMVRKKLRTAA